MLLHCYYILLIIYLIFNYCTCSITDSDDDWLDEKTRWEDWLGRRKERKTLLMSWPENQGILYFYIFLKHFK